MRWRRRIKLGDGFLVVSEEEATETVEKQAEKYGKDLKELKEAQKAIKKRHKVEHIWR